MYATYSPEDNKIRLYSSARLDAETYARVKAAGFRWAPKQALFVCPRWTPTAADLAEELCGEIGDEDTTLAERADMRAERFDGLAERRKEQAEGAKAAVAEIADGIPLGQPILIGHHSERRARRDAEKIQNGMRRAVRLWDEAKYWTDRAAGAIRNAKYKELPAVRARRIKTLEAEERKIRRSLAENAALLKLWEGCNDLNRARLIAGRSMAGWLPVVKHPTLDQYLHPSDVLPFDDRSDYAKENYPTWTLEQVKERARAVYGDRGTADRWLAHLSNRLAYERAMLAEQGGLVSDQIKPEKGGAVQCLWSPRGGWAYIVKVNVVTVKIRHQWNAGGRVFSHNEPFDKLRGVMSAAQVEELRKAGRLIEDSEGIGFHVVADKPETDESDGLDVLPSAREQKPNEFDALRDALQVGVKVVSAPQLFATPPALARRITALAGPLAGCKVLEPSAGTGNLIRAILDSATGMDCCKIVAVEVNHALADALRVQRDKTVWANDDNFKVICADFLSCNGDLGNFDRIVMNPPFANAQDIAHIRHAAKMLKPGGRLVAICAAGPRQREAFQASATEWIDLEPGTFKDSGTNVNVAIVVIDAH